MKRYLQLGIIATLANFATVAAAQEPGEVATATSATESKPAEPAPVVVEKKTEVLPSDDVWSSNYDELDHVMVLDRIDGKADEIQRRISALKQRVDLLRDSVIVGSITPSRTIITHKNELGSSFEIHSLEYKLDGDVIFSKSSKDGPIKVQDKFELLDGVLTPGEHLFETRMELKGTGKGYYSYFRGYRFRVGSRFKLTVAEGRLTKLTVTPYPRPDMSLKPKERLAVKYDVDVSVNNAK